MFGSNFKDVMEMMDLIVTFTLLNQDRFDSFSTRMLTRLNWQQTITLTNVVMEIVRLMSLVHIVRMIVDIVLNQFVAVRDYYSSHYT